MLSEQITTAAAGASSLAALDNLARITWRGLAEGHLTEVTAEAAAGVIEARRLSLRTKPRASRSRPPSASAKRPQRSPDKQRSLERRRCLASSGVVPGRIAGPFTTAQLAVLSVIGRECQKAGTCRLPIDAIAALAGTCRTTVQNTLRLARSLSLVAVQERRREGLRNLPNVVTITADTWGNYLLRRRAQNGVSHVGDSSSSVSNDALTDLKTLGCPPIGRATRAESRPSGRLDATPQRGCTSD